MERAGNPFLGLTPGPPAFVVPRSPGFLGSQTQGLLFLMRTTVREQFPTCLLRTHILKATEAQCWPSKLPPQPALCPSLQFSSCKPLKDWTPPSSQRVRVGLWEEEEAAVAHKGLSTQATMP